MIEDAPNGSKPRTTKLRFLRQEAAAAAPAEAAALSPAAAARRMTLAALAQSLKVVREYTMVRDGDDIFVLSQASCGALQCGPCCAPCGPRGSSAPTGDGPLACVPRPSSCSASHQCLCPPPRGARPQDYICSTEGQQVLARFQQEVNAILEVFKKRHLLHSAGAPGRGSGVAVEVAGRPLHMRLPVQIPGLQRPHQISRLLAPPAPQASS